MEWGGPRRCLLVAGHTGGGGRLRRPHEVAGGQQQRQEVAGSGRLWRRADGCGGWQGK
ncbi:hypothetical protein CRG98_050201, partial [Punica granatum]